MTKKHVIAGVIAATAALGLIVPRIQSHADPAAINGGKQEVQVKFEWVMDQKPAAKALTLATTEDTTGTVSLSPDGPEGERVSTTIQPHINTDGTITVRFNVDHFQSGTDQQLISKRTLKPGARVLLGGQTTIQKPTLGVTADGQTQDVFADIGSETHTKQIFMTATVVPAADGKLPVGDMHMPTRAGGF
jgi:hypothetical protein